MPLPLNWVKYPTSGVLSPELTSEDLEFAKFDRIHEYYQTIKILWLIRSTHLPQDLKKDIRESVPADICRTLSNAVKNGAMDTGWADEFFNVSEETSWRMNGFPRDTLKPMRRLRALLLNPPQKSASTPLANPIKKSSRCNFLNLPAKVREHIYKHLLLRDTIEVGDFDCGVEPKGLLRRTEYEVYDSKARRLRRTTYTVRVGKGRPPINFNVMLLNRAICTESQKVFYGENTFDFRGTAEASLAFFHDRASRLDTLRKVSMRYSCDKAKSFKGCYNATCPIPLPPLTSPPAWRRIFNLFVHTSIGLEDFQLNLDDSFWWQVMWQKGAEDVFEKRGLCEPAYQHANNYRNFLEHVARLGGVNIRLMIDGENGVQERVAFRRDMERVLQQQGFQRPYLAEGQKPMCTCRKKLLKECCIWDKEGKMRRGL